MKPVVALAALVGALVVCAGVGIYIATRAPPPPPLPEDSFRVTYQAGPPTGDAFHLDVRTIDPNATVHVTATKMGTRNGQLLQTWNLTDGAHETWAFGSLRGIVVLTAAFEGEPNVKPQTAFAYIGNVTVEVAPSLEALTTKLSEQARGAA